MHGESKIPSRSEILLEPSKAWAESEFELEVAEHGGLVNHHSVLAYIIWYQCIQEPRGIVLDNPSGIRGTLLRNIISLHWRSNP